MIKKVVNWFKRLKIYLIEDGHIMHCGNGNDYIVIKELKKEWVDKSAGMFTTKPTDDYAEYIKSIGIKGVRTSTEIVMRLKGKTSDVDMFWTNKLYQ